jgi:hypothetical protein
MAKGKRNDKEGQYTTLSYAQLKSQAWRSLSGAAIKVKTLSISKGTAQRAFIELEEKGFIALHNPGNWYHRKAHEWRLTTKRMQTPQGMQLATNDWQWWRAKTKDGPPEYPSP